jgi:hypothetical protein
MVAIQLLPSQNQTPSELNCGGAAVVATRVVTVLMSLPRPLESTLPWLWRRRNVVLRRGLDEMVSALCRR